MVMTCVTRKELTEAGRVDNYFVPVFDLVPFASLETLDDHGGLLFRVEFAGCPVKLVVIINPK